MPFIDLKFTTKKNGQEVAWFKDILGRRVVSARGANVVTAEQLAWLANYYIELQQEQLDAGIGSDGTPMPPLAVAGKRVFVARKDGVAQFKTQGGLRTLWGLGINGHMRNDIRINFLTDQMAKVSITRKPSRDKALSNERRAPWWGLSPASSQKFAAAQAGVFGGAMEDYLDSFGLVQTGNYMVQLAQALNAKKGDLMWQTRRAS